MSNLVENLNEIKRQKDTYILPENIVKGITVFGVEGSADGRSGLKLFKTMEEMQEDTTSVIGDKAVVYRNTYKPVELGEYYSSGVWFPNTVILTEEVTTTYTAGNMMTGTWTLTPTSMTLQNRLFGSGNISYISDDGINYTRTDTTTMPMRLMNPLPTTASVLFTYFCTIKDVEFMGLFEHNGEGYVVAETQLTLDSSSQMLPNYIALGKDGVVTGSEAVYDKLNSSLLFKHKATGYDTDISYFSVINTNIDWSNTSWFKSISLNHDSQTQIEVPKRSQDIPNPGFYEGNSLLVFYHYDYNNQKLYAIYSKNRVYYITVLNLNTYEYEVNFQYDYYTDAYDTERFGSYVSEDGNYIYYQAVGFGKIDGKTSNCYYNIVYKFDLVNQTGSVFKKVFATDTSPRKFDYSSGNLFDIDTDTWYSFYSAYSNGTPGIYKVTTSSATATLVKSLTKSTDDIYAINQSLKILPCVDNNILKFYNVKTGAFISSDVNTSNLKVYVCFDIEDTTICVSDKYIFKLKDDTLIKTDMPEGITIIASDSDYYSFIHLPTLLNDGFVQVMNLIINIESLDVYEIKDMEVSSHGNSVVTDFDKDNPTEVTFIKIPDPYYEAGIPSTINILYKTRASVDIYDSMSVGDILVFNNGSWCIRDIDFDKLKSPSPITKEEFDALVDMTNQILGEID